ncbi:deoxyuridine triphosphatase [Rhinolophus gammaherpesvirus 1]|uniref:Deoxyuridine triphosphatase n=1 Tax=Rhinolophus gammaherpesvirus 1 TaxID=2054179 RepID=A0A2Z5U6D6_9GAMA|nr:deoxyuridine triphosphatase [Rhinolophus gammaherpesvirus 1]BBB06506.1 deoxyuridine triphosphatase [Rhinolophus gammaherpesvirus 1]
MTMRKQRPEVYYEFESTAFKLTSGLESSRVTLTNLHPILVRPFVPTVLPLGLKLLHCLNGQAFILSGQSQKKVFCHTGMIDSGYRGEIKLVVLNTTQYNITLFADELKISLVSFFYSTPLLQDNFLLSRPHYAKDAGFDLYLPEDLLIFPQSSTTLTINSSVPTTSKFFKPVIFGRSGLATEGIVLDVVKWTHNPLTLKIYNFTDNTVRYPVGTRICQVVFVHKRHFPSKLKHFFTYVNINSKVAFYWANVSFIDAKNMIYTNLSSPSCGDTVPPDGNDRGDMGFGSSGK